MKKLLTLIAILLLSVSILASCDSNRPKEDVISVEDGYLVVNGVKTEYKVDEGTAPEVNEDVVTVEDGYLVVNGAKTEYEVKTESTPEIKEDVITVEDGYLVVNGVKTEYFVSDCNHAWKTTTVAPTCREEGYDLKTCTLCGNSVKVNETAKTRHTYAATYYSDTSYHWRACTACGDVKDKAEHQVADDGMCTVCDHPIGDTVGIIYDVSDDGTYALVVEYTGTATKIRIAESYQGLPVTTIYEEVFRNIYTITSVIIPDSVTTIGNQAFSGCSSLTSVVIGDSVTTIGDWTFAYCNSLTSVVIPDSVTTIGNHAFYECSNLTSVLIGNSVFTIGDSAFYNCSNLTSVAIPDSVTTIGEEAFYGCSNLTSVVIGDSVTDFGTEAFYNTKVQFKEYENCKYLGSGDNPYCYLVEVTIKNLVSYKIHENTKVIAGSAFYSCPRLSSIVIPDSVTAIGDYAFYNCSNLTSVVIPDSLTTIGNYAFSDCSSLTSVVIPDSVTTIGDRAFFLCSNFEDVYYTGSEAEWQAIAIGSSNYYLTNATIHYNYVPEN